MNTRYWEKALIKLLHLTNSMYNFNNNGNETEKSCIKTQAEWGKGLKARWYLSTWLHKPHWHLST